MEFISIIDKEGHGAKYIDVSGYPRRVNVGGTRFVANLAVLLHRC